RRESDICVSLVQKRNGSNKEECPRRSFNQQREAAPAATRRDFHLSTCPAKFPISRFRRAGATRRGTRAIENHGRSAVWRALGGARGLAGFCRERPQVPQSR